MAGVVFIVCIPTEEHEQNLARKVKKRVVIQDTPILYKCQSNNISSCAMKSNIKSQHEWRREEQLLIAKDCPGDNYYEALDSSSTIKTNVENLSMQKIMEDILKQLEIKNSAWSHNVDNNFIQIMFTLDSGYVYEEILEVLKEYNIGVKYNSIVSVIPCTLYYKGTSIRESNETKIEEDCEATHHSKDSGWTRFISSVRARLAVTQVVEKIKSDAALTFDFICLVTISTIVCAIGLVETNNVYLLSSMLISPMMGPVMAGTFGSVIRDRMLQKTGVQNELIGLGIATLVGFCYGAVVCICTDRYGENEWPTTEMISRGEIRTLGVGCLIALLSGAAVALGILSDNIASLVGVAISTSLMPPAVNAGLLWSLASVYYIKGNETTRYSSLTYTDYYFNDRAAELTSLGAVSLCLTFVNIICIYVAGILVFKIKEVAPLASRDQARRQFWKYDIKIARDYNRTLNNDDAKIIYKQLYNEMGEFMGEENAKKSFGKKLLTSHLHHSTDLTHENDRVNIKRSQYTWSPCGHASKRPTVQELEDLYSKLIRDKPGASRILNYAAPTRNRRLSQIFPPMEPDIPHDDVLPPIPEIPKENVKVQTSSTHFCSKSKKFIVTPCTLDLPSYH